MKIINKKEDKKEYPEIILTPNGEVISLNNAAKNELKLGKNLNVARVVDVDLIRKASMFSESVDIVPLKSKKYKEGILRSSGTGLNKTVKLSFRIGYDKLDEELVKEKEMLTLTSSIKANRLIAEINCLEASKEILTALKETENCSDIFVNNYSKNDTFICDKSVLEALSISAIALVNEISPTRPVNFSVKRLLHLLQIEVSVRVDTLKKAQCVQDIESIYPFTAIRFAMIDSICEQESISYEAQIYNKSIILRFRLTEQKASTELRAAPFYTSLLPFLAHILAPRKNIRQKYEEASTLQEEETEE